MPNVNIYERLSFDARIEEQRVEIERLKGQRADLLAALEGMLSKDAGMSAHFGSRWPVDLDCRAEQARAAIKKARGESA